MFKECQCTLSYYLFKEILLLNTSSDIVECQSSPCQNEAKCIDGVNQYSCTCKDGYKGVYCEIGRSL